LVAQYGTFKVRATAVNVNYRYVDDELAYLIADSDSEVLVFHASLGDRVSRVLARLPRLRLLVVVEDEVGAGDATGRAVRWNDLLATQWPAARVERDGDDLYMLYTGGTTGMPKGVMCHQHEFVATTCRNFALWEWMFLLLSHSSNCRSFWPRWATGHGWCPFRARR
jgi:acyl-CoA synthetase (AMP-forming)/AMP-acid ligase II